MAFVVLSGCPSSGKTSLALKLKDNFLAKMADPAYTGPELEVVIVEDDIGVLGRTVYSGEQLGLAACREEEKDTSSSLSLFSFPLLQSLALRSQFALRCSLR